MKKSRKSNLSAQKGGFSRSKRVIYALEVAQSILLLTLVFILFSIPGPNMIKPYEFGGVP